MLVSVIIPVYNAEKFLDKSVLSVISQSYQNLELILVDDGSTDNSKQICDNYANNDKRIKIINQKNSGPATARNNGVLHAQGEYIFFLDADDLIESFTIEVLTAEYQNNETDLVMGNFSKLLPNGQVVKQNVSFHPEQEPFEGDKKILSVEETANFVRHFLKYPSNHLISYCWARLYKTSIIKDNKIMANADMKLFEDFVFNLEYLKHIKNIMFINKSVYTYVMHENHVSASMGIVDGDSLTHDMNIFRTKAEEYFQVTKEFLTQKVIIQKEVGHALVHYVIIFFIRTCRLVNKSNKVKIHDEINKVITSPVFIKSLRYYSPSKGNSRILPILAKLQLVNLIILYCRRKAYKRYGKPGVVQ